MSEKPALILALVALCILQVSCASGATNETVHDTPSKSFSTETEIAATAVPEGTAPHDAKSTVPVFNIELVSPESINRAAYYTVKAGDNIFKIVKNLYGLTNASDIELMVDKVCAANGIKSDYAFYEGQVLIVPSR